MQLLVSMPQQPLQGCHCDLELSLRMASQYAGASRDTQQGTAHLTSQQLLVSLQQPLLPATAMAFSAAFALDIAPKTGSTAL